MARLLTTGFETGDARAEPTSGSAPSFVTGTPTVQSSRKRTGTYACRFQGATHLRFAGMGTTSNEPYYHRVYWDIEAWPTGTTYTLQGRPSGYSARLSSAGIIGLYFGATQIGSGLQLALDTQYCVELKSQINTAAGSDDSGELKVDGVSIASETNVARSATASTNYDIGQTAADATFDGYADDLAVNDGQGASQNSWPGLARVVLAKPKADSALGTGWEAPQTTGSDTTGIFAAVDNTPPVGVAHSDADANNLKYVFNAASDAATNLDLTMQDYDEVGVPADATISVVFAFVRGGSSSATLTAGAIDLVSNPDQGTETSIASWDLANVVAATDPTGWNTFEALKVYAPSVTRATDPVVRVGKRTATTRVVMVDFVGLYVEYVEATVAPADLPLQSSPAVANATLALKAQTVVPLASSPAVANATLALKAQTVVPLASSPAQSAATLALKAQTVVPLASSPAQSAATLSLKATTQVPLASLPAQSAATLSISATTQVPLAASAALAAPTLALRAQTTVPLDASAAVSSATAVVTVPYPVPLDASAATSAATLALKAQTYVPTGTSAALSAATLAVSAQTVIPLDASAAVTTGTVALGAATAIPMGASAATASATVSLSAQTVVPLNASVSIAAATLVLTYPGAAVITPDPSAAVSSAALSVSAKTTLPLGTADAQTAATVALTAPTGVVTAPSVATSAGTMALTVIASVSLNAAVATSSTTLAITATPSLTLTTAATSTASASFSAQTYLTLSSAAQSDTTFTFGVPVGMSLDAATAAATAIISITAPGSLPLNPSVAVSTTALSVGILPDWSYGGTPGWTYDGNRAFLTYDGSPTASYGGTTDFTYDYEDVFSYQ